MRSLKATWSPEQIACTPCELKMPSWRTIYRWIYEKYLSERESESSAAQGEEPREQGNAWKIQQRASPSAKRDRSVYSRQEAGHWEADTVVSGQGKE